MNPRLFCRESSYHKTLLLTYSFDPIFFEQVVLPDLWAGRSSDIIAVGDRGQIDSSIVAAVGQLSHLGRNYLLARTNHTGAFHPKVYLRIGPKDGIVMIGSGNVTSSGWGGNQELGTAWAVGPDHPDKGGWLHTFLEDVLSWCDGELEKDAIRRLKDVPWLSLTPAESDLPRPVLHSHQTQALGPQLANRWADRQFEEVKILTGSTDESGAFLRWAHETFGIQRATVALTPLMASFQLEKLADLPIELRLIEAPTDRPLHAKFYWFEGPNGNAAAMGSANCSAAAWLLTPDRNGNIETIVVYDAPEITSFEPVLAIFNGDQKSAAELLKPMGIEKQEAEPSPPFVLLSLRWTRSDHTLEAVLNAPPAPEATVELLLNSVKIRMVASQSDRSVWRCELSEGLGKATVFASAHISLGNHQWTTPSHWVDDLATLEHASQSARLLVPFEGLSVSATSSEQRTMLDDLREVARTLFHETASFRDPSLGKKHKEKAKEEASAPINPQDLVLHLGDRHDPLRHLASSQSDSLSITGILRLLFDAEDEHHVTRIADGDEKIDEGQIQINPQNPVESKQPKPNLIPIEEKFRARLDQQITEFLANLSSPQFAERCTATQMVQAVSFPLAVALRGRGRGWVSEEQSEKWGLEIFSLLFRRTAKAGLLHEIEERYAKNNHLDLFHEVVGDGTLWVVLVATLGNAQWHGVGTDIDKAIALREVFNTTQLLASASQSRIGGLLGRIRIDDARKYVAEIAPRISGLFDQIETMLHPVWEQELLDQMSRQIKHKVGDLMWRKNSGWAICLEDSDTRYAEQIKVRLRGQERRIARGYYVNVTELLSKLPDLSSLITKLRSELLVANLPTNKET